MQSKLKKVTGIISMVQGVIQILVNTFLIAESFCLVNFFQKVEFLSIVKALYLYWPNTCGERLQIGTLVNLLPTHALITYPVIPHTIFRNLILTTLNASLGIVWVIFSFKHMRAGVTGDPLVVRWPWVIVTSTIVFVDLGNFLIFANDSFSTKTLDDIVTFTGIEVSGAGNQVINTGWVSWAMALLYGRMIIMIMFNAGMVITVIIGTEEDAMMHTDDIELQGHVPDTKSETVDFASTPQIPRPGISDTFRSMKSRLLNRSLSLVHRPPSPVPLDVSSERLHRKITSNFKRSVNFLENFALPQPTLNLVSGQKRHSIVADYPNQQLPRASISLPRLDIDPPATTYKRVSRDTAVELQGQLPWAYIPTSTGRMRDLLPADEELPPVPLPDYNTVESHRKISVHRAAISLAQKKTASRANSIDFSPMRMKDIDVFY